MSYDRRQEAVSVLDDLILDMMVGLRSIEIFSDLDDKQQLSSAMRVGLSRLSTTHLVLALAKWMEFYEHYKYMVPSGTSEAAKKFYKDLKARGVRDFRNKTVGHLWDDQVKRPLSIDETKQRLAAVIGSDELEFNRWIYDLQATDPTKHLIGLTEEIRNALKNGKNVS